MRKQLFRSPVHDERICALVVPRLVPARRLPPRRDWMPSARSLSLATTMRMVYRIHRNSAVYWPPPQPARAPSLADRNVLVIQISHLPDRRHAILRDFASLARRQFYQGIIALFRYQLGGSA